LAWAQAAKENPKLTKHKIETPAVVGAIIDLGNCLDLLEAESIRLVSNGYSALIDLYGAAEVRVPTNRIVNGGFGLRYLDCAVINLIHTLREDEHEVPFDSVRAVFVEGESLYEGAGFASKTHIQICARSAKSIVGYFRPLTSNR
jgi:hypothetical protein